MENDSKSKPSNDEEETTHTKSADVTLGNGDDADVTLGNGDDTDVTLDNSDTDDVETDVTTTANFANDSDTDSVTTLVESGADEVQRLQGEPPGGSSGLATVLELCQKYRDFIFQMCLLMPHPFMWGRWFVRVASIWPGLVLPPLTCYPTTCASVFLSSSPAPPSYIYTHIFIFSSQIHAHTTTFMHFLGYFSHLRCTFTYFMNSLFCPSQYLISTTSNFFYCVHCPCLGTVQLQMCVSR